MSRRSRPSVLDGVVRLLDAVGACADRVGDWTAETETGVRQARTRLRIARRTATAEELMSWVAGELGELGEVYLKNLLLGEMRQRREAEADAVKLITELRDGDAGSVDRQEVAELLAKFREELDGESR
jgi:hypothetical protein